VQLFWYTDLGVLYGIVLLWNCFARMSFEDFVMIFDFLWVCHLEPDAVAEEISSANVCTMICVLSMVLRSTFLEQSSFLYGELACTN